MEFENQRENREKIPDTVDSEYESWLSRHHPVNSGIEALIFHVTPEEESHPLLDELVADRGRDADPAIKVLKVYKPEKAKNEFEWQQKAYQVLNEAREQNPSTPLAKVPTPIDNRDINITEETRTSLNHAGTDLSGDKLGLMMMDFIHGRDLQHIFYEWIVTHAPGQFEVLVQSTDTTSFEQLSKAVSIILQFGSLESRGTVGADREIEDRRKKVLSHLKKSGFVLNPRILEIIRNTRQVLNRNNIYHNDDHERNFMITGEPTNNKSGQEPEVYMIDFAAANSRPPDEHVKFVIEEHLKELVPNDNDADMVAEIESKTMNPNWIRTNAGFFESTNETLKSKLSGSLYNAASTETSFDDFVAVMLKLVKDNRLRKTEALSYIQIIRERLILRQPKKQDRIINPNIYNKAQKYTNLFN